MANVKSGYVTKRTASGKTYREESNSGVNAFLNLKGEGRQVVKHFMTREADLKKDWRGLIATPPGSILQKVITPFRKYTDIPLELPLFATIHYIATYLNKSGCKLTGDKIPSLTPCLWNVILAPSGAGKTLSHDWIGEAAPVKSNLVNCESAAKFFDELKRCKDEDGYASWFCDEFAQKLKMIETPNSPLGELKPIALKSYSGERIDRATKKSGTQIIEDPSFNFYGVNTEKSFIDSISVESMADGFAQRFGYIYTEADPDRPMTDYPMYDQRKISEELAGAFNALTNLELYDRYIITGEAEQEYFKVFKDLFQEGSIPNSFYRRAQFKTLTYALIYHALNLKTSQYIDGEDIQWASRVTEMHLGDVKRIFDEKDMSGFGEQLKRIKGQKDRAESQGKHYTASQVANGNRNISNAEEGAKWLDFLDDGK